MPSNVTKHSLEGLPDPGYETTGCVVGVTLVVVVTATLVVLVVAPGPSVVLDAEGDVVVVVVAASLANSTSSKRTVATAAAELVWKLAVKRTLCVPALLKPDTFGRVCHASSVKSVATNDDPAPADPRPLFPVQSVPVYAWAVRATWMTSVDEVRYAKRNVGKRPDGAATQALSARASVDPPALVSSMLKVPLFAVDALQPTDSPLTADHDAGSALTQSSKPGFGT
jgi:hypothetical protein